MTDSRFAGRLKELRARAGLTQKDLAEKAGLKYGAVRDLEQGLNGPTWDTVLALAGVLGVSCEAFNQEPAELPQQGRGRPAKPKAEESIPAPKRSRGRPRKEKVEE